jgi:hypothetical protein
VTDGSAETFALVLRFGPARGLPIHRLSVIIGTKSHFSKLVAATYCCYCLRETIVARAASSFPGSLSHPTTHPSPPESSR